MIFSARLDIENRKSEHQESRSHIGVQNVGSAGSARPDQPAARGLTQTISPLETVTFIPIWRRPLNETAQAAQWFYTNLQK